MKRISTLVVALSLLVGCGLPAPSELAVGHVATHAEPLVTAGQTARPNSGLQAITPVSGHANSGSAIALVEPFSETSSNGSAEEVSGRDSHGNPSDLNACCFAECWDGRSLWYYVGNPAYGQCRAAAQSYCDGLGLGYKDADWRPCPRG